MFLMFVDVSKHTGGKFWKEFGNTRTNTNSVSLSAERMSILGSSAKNSTGQGIVLFQKNIFYTTPEKYSST
ncbi:MAG: hypothetical protein NZ455_00895 [Bacteroidia bacterium]|nr:hypothetical protein [Bacteroidia bacterium]MDW8347912.1 hypothetical protein [Bacteroidia bacterium]